MEYFVYIIQSETTGRYYIGSTHDMVLRLEHHNDGWTRSTKGRGPWKVVHEEKFATKLEAQKRERQIKSMKSRLYIERLIHYAGGRPDTEMVSGSPVDPAFSWERKGREGDAGGREKSKRIVIASADVFCRGVAI